VLFRSWSIVNYGNPSLLRAPADRGSFLISDSRGPVSALPAPPRNVTGTVDVAQHRGAGVNGSQPQA
jgi:hypothetical protein